MKPASCCCRYLGWHAGTLLSVGLGREGNVSSSVLVGDGATRNIFFADGDDTFGGVEASRLLILPGLPSAVTSTKHW